MWKLMGKKNVFLRFKILLILTYDIDDGQRLPIQEVAPELSLLLHNNTKVDERFQLALIEGLLAHNTLLHEINTKMSVH